MALTLKDKKLVFVANITEVNSESARSDGESSGDDGSSGWQDIKPVIVCGPSGVGKGTLLNRLKAEHPGVFEVAVSHTSRGAREGERDGHHYHFVTRENFENLINEGAFLEYADVHGNYYGTSLKAVETVANNGCICLLEIDIQGAQNVKEKTVCNSVFVDCPGEDAQAKVEVLRERLTGRGTENESKIAKRLKTAESEFTFLDNNPTFFDHIIHNDNVDNACKILERHFSGWYPSKVVPSETN